MIRFLLLLFMFLISCNQTRNNSKQPISSNDARKERQVLIDELKRLSVILSSNNKEQIARIFPFPLTDTAFNLYLDNDLFYEQKKKNNNATTKSMFIDFFPQIHNAFQIDGLNQLFKMADLDSLILKNTLEYKIQTNDEPCYKLYSIEINKDIVTLTINSGVNEQYQSTSNSDDEIPENSSEFCEHNFWWEFKFDNNHLRLIRVLGAD